MLAIPTKTRPAGSTGTLQFRDALGKFKGTSGLTFNETIGTLAFVGSAQTANNPLLDLSQPWNNAAVAFAGLKFNAIGGATSGAGSLLQDLQLDGTTKFSVRKDGLVVFGQTKTMTKSGTDIVFNDTVDLFTRVVAYGFRDNNSSAAFGDSGDIYSGVALASAACLQWTNSNANAGTRDLRFFRDAAGIFAQRNGVNAQAFRVYNTWTDANNGEWGGLSWASSVLSISTANNGTGVQRNLNIKGANLQFWGGSTYFATAAGIISMGILPVSNGIARLIDNSGSDFGRLQIGGATASYPAIKRSGATVQARLADDTGFTFIQGKHQTEAPAVIETLVLMRSLTLYDSTGTAYKVPCT